MVTEASAFSPSQGHHLRAGEGAWSFYSAARPQSARHREAGVPLVLGVALVWAGQMGRQSLRDLSGQGWKALGTGGGFFPCDLQEVNFHWAVTHRQPTCLGSDTLPLLPHTPPWDLGASLKLLVLTNNSHYLLGLSVYVGYLPTQAPTLHPFDR